MIKLKNLTILYVEDDIEAQNNISNILSILFQNVFVTSNGKEALNIFNKNKIDIILTDYEMPVMDGYEFIENIRAINNTIPIIILSNHTEKEKLLKCIPLKLIEYLEKPIIYDKLIGAFNNCVNEIKNTSGIYIIINKKISYNPDNKEIIKDKEIIKLTSLEMKAFEFMYNRRNKLIYKEELLSYLYEDEKPNDNVLKHLIYRLRKKLQKELFLNYKNLGYIFKVD